MAFAPNQTLRFELVEGIALIPGTCGDTSGYFAFDTGATQTVLNQAHCAAEALPAEGGKSAVTFDNGTQSSGISELCQAHLTLDGCSVELEHPPLMDMTYVETPLQKSKEGLCFLGSIGADLIGQQRMLIDYPAGRVTLEATEIPPFTASVPLLLERLPVIELKLADSTFRFVLDTGANHFVMDASVAPAQLFQPSPEEPGLHMLPSLSFAGMTSEGLTGMLTDLTAVRNALHVDGIIGYQLLKDHAWCFDAPGRALLLLSSAKKLDETN